MCPCDRNKLIVFCQLAQPSVPLVAARWQLANWWNRFGASKTPSQPPKGGSTHGITTGPLPLAFLCLSGKIGWYVPPISPCMYLIMSMCTDYVLESLSQLLTKYSKSKEGSWERASMTWLVGNRHFGYIWTLEVGCSMRPCFKRAKKPMMVAS